MAAGRKGREKTARGAEGKGVEEAPEQGRALEQRIEGGDHERGRGGLRGRHRLAAATNRRVCWPGPPVAHHILLQQ